MAKKTIYLLLIVFTIILGTIFYRYFCCCTCDKKVEKYTISTSKPNLKLSPFILKDGNFSFKTNENFKFLNEKSLVIQPISDSLNLGLNNLKEYFLVNPNKILKITRFAKSDEKNESLYPNLGYARAIYLKNLLVSKGFNPAKFELEGVINKNWMMKGDTLLGPNEFKIINKEESNTSNNEDWDKLKQTINESPMVIYFNSGQTNVNLNEAERQKVADISKYLDNVPNTSILIEGHTDNIGSRPLNIELGLKRANFIKEYLIKNGINAEQIKTNSKGPDNPIATNDTEEGRTKNRRSIITIN